ncbi:MAG TPA: LytTR family DNA-binding domain-containing protein [Longimicrobiales bacterium]
MPDIRTLVVDDEPAARRGLRALLQAQTGFEVVGEARHGREALELITQLRPELVFLDIQMPEMTGLEVVEALRGGDMPVVVFVTAYDEWAVRAFEVQALDYVLKPFEDERLQAVLRRVRAHFVKAQPGEFLQKVEALLATARTAPSFLSRLLVRDAGSIHFIPLADVDWIEAADYYARVHAGKTSQLVRYTLNDLEQQLDPQQFMRVHRSAIVRIARIKEIRIAHNQHHTLVLSTGTTVPLSRGKREQLEAALARA